MTMFTTDEAGPAFRCVAVTKSDATTYDGVRGLYVGGAGDLSLILAGDTSAVTFSSVPAGTLLPVQAKKVMNATTATNIVALY